MKKYIGIALFIGLVFIGFIVHGCTQAQVDQIKAKRDEAKAYVAATTQATADAKAQAQQITDPKEREEALARIKLFEDKILAPLVTHAKQADVVVDAIASKDPAAIGNIAATIPGTGGWGALAGAIVTGIWGEMQRRKKNEALQTATDAVDEAQEAHEHLKNVVFSIEQGIGDLTPEQKKALAALQGPETTARVHEIKNSVQDN